MKDTNKVHQGMITCVRYTSNFKTLVSSCVNGDTAIGIDHLSIAATKVQTEDFDGFFGTEFDPYDTKGLEEFLEKMVEKADPDDF